MFCSTEKYISLLKLKYAAMNHVVKMDFVFQPGKGMDAFATKAILDEISVNRTKVFLI